MSWTQRMRERVDMETDLAGLIPGRSREELRNLAVYLDGRLARGGHQADEYAHLFDDIGGSD